MSVVLVSQETPDEMRAQLGACAAGMSDEQLLALRGSTDAIAVTVFDAFLNGARAPKWFTPSDRAGKARRRPSRGTTAKAVNQ